MLVTGRGSIAQVQYTGEESAIEVKKLIDAVIENEDDFDKWETLVVRATDLEGGITRNSSPAAIELVRNVFDCFLAKFPLFFGYWKKYADLEFAIGGTETAEMVYERGVSCIPSSVDTWTNYCTFKMDTCHDYDIIRDLFERAAQFIGLDYHGHPFWDKYVEFEERVQEPSRVTKLHQRIVAIPIYQFQRYYEKFRGFITGSGKIEDLAGSATLDTLRAAVLADNQGLPEKSELELERELRMKIDQYYWEIYGGVQTEVQNRWLYEQHIKRAYFHVTDVEESELAIWRKYLDYEEGQGNFQRIMFLNERCLVACALYPEFWQRYARWMFAQGKEEDARLIYMRASCIFVPISQPTIRLNWARFEEKLGRIQVARDIHVAILDEIPEHVETIISLAGVVRRHEGNDAAVQLLDEYINQRDVSVAGILVAEQARILWRCKGSVDEARKLFQDKHTKYLDSREFWVKYLNFEIDQPTLNEKDARIKEVHDLLRAKGRFSSDVKKELSHIYMKYLLDCGGKDISSEYMQLDKDVNEYVRD
ncbi:TPR-like protein [Melanomma pulvis-pyrius CBS 109.77]|uniref:TPR-like protein n=1 Tax=Melanomma pulvis-pyrius CBS 109.77 TaxID=1314802 RepID=A0A6A6XHH8_9PLEO|nr:TPR-like protein [Melanomma pulvis-pyrius CBS 109.77]